MYYQSYHISPTVMEQHNYGNLMPAQILLLLMHPYGKPFVSKLKSALLRLHDPMDQMSPIKVMLRKIEEIQIFQLLNPKEDCHLKQTQPTAYALTKITNTSVYTKAIKKWQAKDVNDIRGWGTFHTIMVAQYERMLCKGSEPTVS